MFDDYEKQQAQLALPAVFDMQVGLDWMFRFLAEGEPEPLTTDDAWMNLLTLERRFLELKKRVARLRAHRLEDLPS